jgi:hypothetical protein
MLIDRRLLAVVGRRSPAIYDVIPRGPLNVLSKVALNPQPLPPHEWGAAVAAEFVQSAWLSERFGSDLDFAFNLLDDWCPTVPKPPKRPPWWPPIPDPEPRSDWFIDFHLGFAARIALALDEFEGTRLGELLDKGIERSIASIESVISQLRN